MIIRRGRRLNEKKIVAPPCAVSRQEIDRVAGKLLAEIYDTLRHARVPFRGDRNRDVVDAGSARHTHCCNLRSGTLPTSSAPGCPTRPPSATLTASRPARALPTYYKLRTWRRKYKLKQAEPERISIRPAGGRRRCVRKLLRTLDERENVPRSLLL